MQKRGGGAEFFILINLGCLQKSLRTHALNQLIRKEVKCNTSITSKQIKKNTDALCSPRTIRRHLNLNGFRMKSRKKKPKLLNKHKIARLEFAKKHQTWCFKKWKRVVFSDEKSLTSIDQMVSKNFGFQRKSNKNIFLNVTQEADP